MKLICRSLLILSCLLFVALSEVKAEAVHNAKKRPNVLFIAVDDLRPQLGCFGFDNMHTPNIDRLAAGGTVFERAFCMVPTCGASRASLMTGVRPSPNRFVNYLAWAEKDAPGATTLNTHFKNNGYTTISNGKVFHHLTDSASGWSEPATDEMDHPMYAVPENQALHEKRSAKVHWQRGPAFEAADVPDDTYGDGLVLKKSIADLQRLAKQDEPFFLATGFFKPHLPFVAPQKYWDLYDRNEIQLPATYHKPKNAPWQSIHTWGELRAYAGIPKKGPVSDDTARTLIHGYYACISYTDALVGQLLDELDRLGLSENTIVVLWGDHGWNLGEHTLWCKHSCFETSLHAPLIVKAPGFNGGQKTPALTEFIDIYPSLCELAGLPLPKHLQGQSFTPLMKNPQLPWKKTAISRYGPGDSIRTDRYRFSQYRNDQGVPNGRMLYDHQADPGEDNNIAAEEAAKTVVEALSRQLDEGKGKDRKVED